jgi:hypothetical protein
MLLLVTEKSNHSFTEVVRDAFSSIRMFKTHADGWQAVRKIPLDVFRDATTDDQTKELLESHVLSFVQDVGYKANWLLSVPPLGPHGFAIDLSNSGSEYQVLFGELEERFLTLSDALVWVARAISDTYQLRVTRIGGRPREWALEPILSAGHAPSRQAPSLATGDLVLFRSFRSVQTDVFRNTLRAP